MKRKFLAWLLTIAMVFNMALPYAAFADELPIDTDASYSADEFGATNNDDATDVEGEPTVGEPSTDDEPVVGEPSDEEPAVDPVDGNENNAESDGKEGESADEPQGDDEPVGDEETPADEPKVEQPATDVVAGLLGNFAAQALNEGIMPVADVIADTIDDTIDVVLTVNNKGVLAATKSGSVAANLSVAVADLNGDGKFSVDEAMVAAHKQYKNADDYVANELNEVFAVQKLWGKTGLDVSFYVNGTAVTSTVDASYIQADDVIYASVNLGSDLYTDFSKVYEQKAFAGKNFTLTLVDEKAKPVQGVQVGVWKNQTFTQLDSKVTDDKGQVTLTFDEVGVYDITAKGTVNGKQIMAPFCQVTVEENVQHKLTSLALYASEDNYKDNKNSFVLTPAFSSDVRSYVTSVPDYLNISSKPIYMAGTVDPKPTEAEIGDDTFAFYTINWAWRGVAVDKDGKFATPVYKNGDFGAAGFYFKNESSAEAYKIELKQYATLSALTVSGAVMDKTFDKDVTEYHAYVTDNAATSIGVKAQAYQGYYTMTANETKLTNNTNTNVPVTWDDQGKCKLEIKLGYENTTNSASNIEFTTYTIELEKMPEQAAPFILTQPVGATYITADTPAALSVTASASGALTYQWYSNTVNSSDGGTLIADATAASYTPSVATVGTTYYYCRITNGGAAENNVAYSTPVAIQVCADPTPKATISTTGVVAKPNSDFEYLWDKGYFYDEGDTATTLNVTVENPIEGCTYTYQWVSPRQAYNNTGFSGFPGDVSGTSYTPLTKEDPTAVTLKVINDTGKFYGCKVTCRFNGKDYTSFATTGEAYADGGKTYDVQGVFVFVKAKEAGKPVFNTQPASAIYMVGDTMQRLSVNVPQVNDTKITYQWYQNDKNSTEGATAISAAQKNYYKISTKATADMLGVKYYYVVATNTVQGKTASTTSDIVKIEVKDPENLVGSKLTGKGTEDEPYLINTAADYKAVADLVAEGVSFDGKYLKQTDNIKLPADWQHIGILKDESLGHIDAGKNMLAFSGTLLGNNKTVTIAEGSEPLFGYVYHATIKDLNIFGKKIAGYGLVNHFEGRDLSGVGVTIDNVTLKEGSSTLKSGLIGSYCTNSGYSGCSATYSAVIKNCKIEKDVVVGYNKDESMIGSFAGRLNCTIENCTSSATVYGDSYVGGIVGTKDNAMGACSVKDCSFDGTVVATGKHAGGIVGGGYVNSTAPNGAKVSVYNCTVSGSVTGADKVGGILGGDSFVAQPWDSYTFANNFFNGKVKATDGSYVGGIIGFYDSLNRVDALRGNCYDPDCGAERGIGFVKYLDTSYTDPAKMTGTEVFSTEKNTEKCPEVTGCWWTVGYNRTDDPLGKDADNLCYAAKEMKDYVSELTMTTADSFKTTYYIGDKLDLTGATFKAVWNSGKIEENLATDNLTITGFDSSARKMNMVVSVDYQGAVVTFVVNVLKADSGSTGGSTAPSTIKVKFTLMGDYKHEWSEDDPVVHTLKKGGLKTWIAQEEYTIGLNDTVKDLLDAVAAKHKNVEFVNPQGNWLKAVTFDGLTLEEKDNTDMPVGCIP